jgi:hypothetical protein
MHLPPRAVLRQRCDHFRARCGAGWADSEAQVVRVPDHFGRPAVAAFLHYVYHGGWAACCRGVRGRREGGACVPRHRAVQSLPAGCTAQQGA